MVRVSELATCWIYDLPAMDEKHRGLARPYFCKRITLFLKAPIADPVTARERIADYHAFSKFTDKLINIAKDVADKDVPMDVQDLFAKFTLDTAGEFLFGTSDFNTLDLPLPEAGKSEMGPKGSAIQGTFGSFATAFEEAQIEVVRRAVVTDIVWTMEQLFSDQLVVPQATMDAYLMPVARKALADKTKRREGEEEHQEESFLEHLAASTDGTCHFLRVG